MNPEWPTVTKGLQEAGYQTASIGKTHYHGMPPTDEVRANGIFDLRDFNGFVGRFGWDYVLEEHDRYVLHASRRLKSPYMDHLAAHGVAQDYREMIRSVFRLTPEHWRRAKTSILPQEPDLTWYLAGEAIDWLDQRSGDKPFFLKLAFVQPHVPLIDDPVWADYYKDAEIDLPNLTLPEPVNYVWARKIEALTRHSQVQMMDEGFVREGIRRIGNTTCRSARSRR